MNTSLNHIKLTAILLCMLICIPVTLPAQDLLEQVSGNLRDRIKAAVMQGRILIGSELICTSGPFGHFYEGRAFQPAWSSDYGPTHHVYALIKVIRNAYEDGMDPRDYHLDTIDEILDRILKDRTEIGGFNPQDLAELDLLLTDSFFIYAAHLLSGRVNPEILNMHWQGSLHEKDLAEVLTRALTYTGIEKVLKELMPPYMGYMRLRQALAQYRKIASQGGWPRIHNGRKLKKGAEGEEVFALRSRLIASGDLDPELHEDPYLFDDVLEQALKGFQQRHGLAPDGIVGRATLDALNISAGSRVRQIELNMERWRWLPHNLGERYIAVNIADFQATVFENGRPVMSMKVVVGKDYRQTPALSGKMTYIVLSPHWHIPAKIAIEDKLPLIQKDPDYLIKQHIRIFDEWGREVRPQAIDWSQVNADTFSYRLRQDPGPWNALGRIKFMFPNDFAVYLHDTPSIELFNKTNRTFSSGCIRIEKPIELAEYLLAGDPRWTRKRILAAMNSNTEQTIVIPNPLQVHLLYWTAWAKADGTVHFRRDIYDRDQFLDLALRKVQPKSQRMALSYQ